MVEDARKNAQRLERSADHDHRHGERGVDIRLPDEEGCRAPSDEDEGDCDSGTQRNSGVPVARGGVECFSRADRARAINRGPERGDAHSDAEQRAPRLAG